MANVAWKKLNNKESHGNAACKRCLLVEAPYFPHIRTQCRCLHYTNEESWLDYLKSIQIPFSAAADLICQGQPRAVTTVAKTTLRDWISPFVDDYFFGRFSWISTVFLEVVVEISCTCVSMVYLIHENGFTMIFQQVRSIQTSNSSILKLKEGCEAGCQYRCI